MIKTRISLDCRDHSARTITYARVNVMSTSSVLNYSMSTLKCEAIYLPLFAYTTKAFVCRYILFLLT